MSILLTIAIYLLVVAHFDYILHHPVVFQSKPFWHAFLFGGCFGCTLRICLFLAMQLTDDLKSYALGRAIMFTNETQKSDPEG